MKKFFQKSLLTQVKNLFGQSLPRLNKRKFLYKQNFINELNTFEKSLRAESIKDLNEKFTQLKESNKKLEALILLHNTTAENPQIRMKIENPQKCESEEETEIAETIVSNKMEIVQEMQREIVKHNDSYYRIFLKKFEHRNEIRKTGLLSILIFVIFFSFYFGKSYKDDLVKYLNSIFHFKQEKKEPSKKMENISLTVDSGMSTFSKKQNFRIMKNIKERLDEVKGIDEVKDEIQEVVKMMKNPEKYEKAGAKLIKGILLVGKPGTGKTLLARALAGESGVNFIAMSASEFDKSLVGMGSKLLKDLFNQARQNQPCIIFIDEIDTLLHASRRSGKYSSTSERGLINTFLAEMDGFSSRDYIFVLGATNSEKDLDKAAMRPGRFDKIIYVPLPDKKGRQEIFNLYLNKIKLPVMGITPEVLSKMTPGFTGAEIENMVNTTIINAVNMNKKSISKEDFEDARDRLVMGIKRKVNQKNVRALLQSAVHEAGHTLVCYKDRICKPGIHKVSIVPHGKSRSKTSTLHDDMQGTKEEFISMIDKSIAGLIAEEIFFGSDKVSVGCGNDLNRATSLAKSMVKRYAMNKEFGYMVVEDNMIVSHKISGDTRNELDKATSNILKQRSSIIKEILQNNIVELKNLTQNLVEYEELSKFDIERILSGKEIEGEDDKAKVKKRDFSIEGMAI